MTRYRSLNSCLRERFGCKVYKLALDGGFTCPNRDGTLDTRGCIFCSGSGSGSFAVSACGDMALAVERAKAAVASKVGSDGKYIAYFQSFTGTYAPVERLEKLYAPVLGLPDIAALSIGTRPDCLGGDVIALLERFSGIKPVWVELGLQTIHPATAEYIRRGYDLPVFDDAVRRLKDAGLEIVVHMIIGLPGETDEMIYETAEYVGGCGADGVKLQVLDVIENRDVVWDYENGAFETLTLEKYADLLEGCIRRIPPEMVVHRITGDGAKSELIAPLWSADKKRVLNYLNERFERDDLRQGSLLEDGGGAK